MPTIKPSSAAVLAARAKRAARNVARQVEIEWFIENVSDVVATHMRTRVSLATELLKTRIVQNISRPVLKTYTGKVAGVTKAGKTKMKWALRVSDRSKPGEFPKADTTLLMKTIFSEVVETRAGTYDGYVGTPLDYGVELELLRHRSFLVRTFQEEYDKVMRILSGPIA